MKRGDLLRYLMAQGCVLLREGAKHSIWLNPATGQQATIGRHRELDNLLCAAFASNWASRRLGADKQTLPESLRML